MKNKRNHTLDLLKFLFGIMIVIYHGRKVTELKDFPFYGGYLAVEFFFIVSGFYLADSALRKADRSEPLGRNTVSFILHKINGYLPNYYLAWIIAFFVKAFIQSKPTLANVGKRLFSSLYELLFITESGLTGIRSNQVTWYISAMLIAMFVLYPIIRLTRDSFTWILAPLITVFMTGIAYQNFSSLASPHTWVFTLMFKTLYRAFMGLSYGAFIWQLTQDVRRLKVTRLTRSLLTIAEIGLYGGIFYYCYYHGYMKNDLLIFLVMGFAVLLTASELSWTNQFLTDNLAGLCGWLGRFSLSLYLSHGFYAQSLTSLSFIKALSPNRRMLAYLIISLITALFVMYFSLWLKKRVAKAKPQLRRLILNEPQPEEGDHHE